MGVVAAVGAVIGAVAGGVSAYESHEAGKDQKEANRQQQNAQRAQENESRRAQLREERVRRSQIIAASENTGTTGSSGAAGALSVANTTTAGNLGFQAGQTAFADAQTAAVNSAIGHQSNATTAGAVSNAGSSVFSAAGGSKAVSTLFKS